MGRCGAVVVMNWMDSLPTGQEGICVVGVGVAGRMQDHHRLARPRTGPERISLKTGTASHLQPLLTAYPPPPFPCSYYNCMPPQGAGSAAARSRNAAGLLQLSALQAGV